MEQQTTRPRGRPQGSSPYNTSDPRYLLEVARKLLADPTMSMRAAISQVVTSAGVKPNQASAIRRLQDKFKPREFWMEQAREEQRARERQAQETREFLRNIAEIPNSLRLLGEQINRSPEIQALSQSWAEFTAIVGDSLKNLRPYPLGTPPSRASMLIAKAVEQNDGWLASQSRITPLLEKPEK